MPSEKKQEQVVRPETPRSEDPARLNDLNPDQDTKEIAKDTAPKQVREQIRQDQGQVRSPRTEIDPGRKEKKHSRMQDMPTNPPHEENDGTLWATEEQGTADNAKA